MPVRDGVTTSDGAHRSGQRFRVDGWVVDPPTNQLSKDGKTVRLEPKVMELLLYLADRPGVVISRDQIEDAIWGGLALGYDTVTGAVAKLRRVLGDDARNARVIETIPKKGYRLLISPEPAIPVQTRSRALQVWAYALAALLLVAMMAIVVLARGHEGWEHKVAIAPAKPTLTILPFENLSGDPEQRYFSDGLTEDLTTDLSRIWGIRTISRASSFIYRDSTSTPREIAQDLGATHFVTGSVRRDGRRVRINATLTEVASGAIVWADRYDRDIGGIFELQDEVTRAIISALEVELTESEESRVRRQRSVDPDAYDLLLRGLEPLRSFTREGTVLARSFFRRAIEVDPEYARAHADLSLSYSRTVVFRLEPDEQAVDVALREAKLAASLDPTVPQVQYALAVGHLAARNYDLAVEAARQSIELNRGYADGYAVLAQCLAYAGELDEALASIRTAKTLNPRYLFDYLWVEAHILFQMRRYEEARAILEEVTERNPAFLAGHLTLAATLGYLGDASAISWEVSEVMTLDPDFSATKEASLAPYRREQDRRHFVEGLKLAGLPD